ncbi:6,7-dimethyl-8-ribityllumazine synthase [Vulcanimicrobium alpinum]|uniref:6,7-dimethyl-8-ribityllumazine synthase n=1 Tax=Vulcanimicrobium alpinum TaxID=3016050 RepID=A0AAN1XX39_UNVUL|nr:6,7-dimethyl-8-ribityllumazine synthase [Vulcanimicrobium alpinum]BDE05948.1 6,7-dimethyl-8-ribityllumazine synthase [Vulcanimicrobium alpinum]
MKTEKAHALPDASGKRFAILVADFYADLAAQLEDGARRALRDCGVAADAIETVRVPGCFELPIAARRLIAGSQLDGVVALGVVIRGDTPHFDFVAGECARGIMDVMLGSGIPIGFGVLTTENRAQAEERADPARGDKGYEAAVAAATVATIEPKRETARVGFR